MVTVVADQCLPEGSIVPRSGVPRSSDLDSSSPDFPMVLQFVREYTKPAKWSLDRLFGINVTISAMNDESSLQYGQTEIEVMESPPNNVGSPQCCTSDAVILFGEVPRPTYEETKTQYLEIATLPYIPSIPSLTPWDRLAHGLIDEVISFLNRRTGASMTDPLTRTVEKLYPFVFSGHTPQFFGNYFTHWNRHSPVIHRPTFKIAASPAPLSFAISIVGALLCEDTETKTLAEQLLDLAEYYIFEHEALLTGDFHCRSTSCVRQALPAIQAALCIVQAQLRNKSAKKRETVRNKRFGQLAAAIRHLGVHHHLLIKNTDNRRDWSYRSHWQEFGIDEAVKRVCYGVFNIDASFSILYDIPPRLTLQDIQVTLPCGIEHFTARNPEEFQTLFVHDPKQDTSLSLNNAFSVMFKERNCLAKLSSYRIDALHLWVLILGKSYHLTAQCVS